MNSLFAPPSLTTVYVSIHFVHLPIHFTLQHDRAVNNCKSTLTCCKKKHSFNFAFINIVLTIVRLPVCDSLLVWNEEVYCKFTLLLREGKHLDSSYLVCCLLSSSLPLVYLPPKPVRVPPPSSQQGKEGGGHVASSANAPASGYVSERVALGRNVEISCKKGGGGGGGRETGGGTTRRTPNLDDLLDSIRG